MTRAEAKNDRSIDLFAVRSVLFLPASNPRAIAKAREAGADLVVLDLEDAVKTEDKAAARKAAVEAVADAWTMPIAIRINGVGSKRPSRRSPPSARREP
jgi:citrate lyase subunit beta/citryl-CoA lyase